MIYLAGTKAKPEEWTKYSALPPKGEARRYVVNDFLNLVALRQRGTPCFPSPQPLSLML